MRNRVRFAAAVLYLISASRVATAQGRFFDSNGVRLHYIDQGTGESVVLVHGRNNSVQTWVVAGVVSELAKNYRVIAFDCRGHGLSEKPHDPKQYGREMALDTVRLLDHLGILRAHVVGYSMGATVTSKLLTIQPDRFISATLGGSAGRLQWIEPVDFEKQAAETESLGFSPSARELAGEKLTEAEIKKRSSAALANPGQDRFAVAALIRSFADLTVTAQEAARVTVPTLGIAGSEDPNLTDLRELTKVRPTVRLEVIEGATHEGALRRREFLTFVRKFLGAHPLTP